MKQQEEDQGLRVSETTCQTTPVYETMTVERKQPISTQDSFVDDLPPPPVDDLTPTTGSTEGRPLSRVRTKLFDLLQKNQSVYHLKLK